MHKKKFLTRLASGTLVAAAATAFLTAGVASATALPRSVDAASVQADDAATTTTTLNVTPSSPADANTTETLTATLNPTSAAGSVQFTDAGTALGDPVDVTNGTASTTVTLPPGDHSLTAVFTPDDTTAFSSSTSDTVNYTVNGAATGAAATTTTTLEVTPSSPTHANTTETLTATLNPTSAAGSVQFTDAGTALGDPVDVTNGTASTTVTLPPGDHSLTAVFTPSDTTAFSSSTSDTVNYTVNGNQANRHGNHADLGRNHDNRHNKHRNTGSNRNNPALGNLSGILGILGGIQGILGGALNNPGANPGADNLAGIQSIPGNQGGN